MTLEKRSFKTPVGVWVIVGMSGVFVLGGIGISAFIVWKSMGGKHLVPLTNSALGEKAVPVASMSRLSEGEVGVEHPKPNPAIKDAEAPSSLINDRADEERMRREVLKRIDLMKALTEMDKDRLYAQVERARGFRKMATIPFAQNRMIAGAAQVDELIKCLKAPELQKLLADPTVALIMVGYADKKGDETKNLDISRSRAESVVKAIKERMDLVNVIHAVGMGSQDIFDRSNLERNRVVEVWAVQP
ncbi:MAG: OmpA family protein [Verrucomicrobia bacterium]|nr:OmpA family protein [Verrucomicrobiota bacterium]MBV9300188.1 OmpA family protein [Verrucomicrobiota bacterium]